MSDLNGSAAWDGSSLDVVSDTRRAALKRKIAAHHDNVSEISTGGLDRCYANLAEHAHAEADELEKLNDPLLRVSCGEIVPHASSTKRQGIADTLRNPRRVNADASIARTDLLLQDSTDLVSMAVDAAESIKAKNSLEKMLAHQLALCHSMAFRTMEKAVGITTNPRLRQDQSVELARLAATSARLMDTYQRGLLTLQKLRSGGSQTVVVKHVTVEAGGQAIVGNVEAGRGKRRGRRSK